MKKEENVYIAPMPKDLKKKNVQFHDWTPDAQKLINERFLRRDQSGKVLETIEEMCWRVAYCIATADKKYGLTEEDVIKLAIKFYDLMAGRKFFPNAPTLYNAGTGNGLQFSACFVLPIEDSMEGIYDAIKWQALIHKSGGGTGFSFSSLRPKNAIVGSTRGKSSGPISFLEVFDASTDKVTQGGTRRGANMAMFDVHHPDILEAIACKGMLRGKNNEIYEWIRPHIYSRKALDGLKTLLLGTQISHFNISIAATDIFMEALEKDGEYDLLDPRNGEVCGQLKAKMVFDLIVKMAWEGGCPGLWFVDKTNRGPANPIPELMKIESTNPCGEQPLFPYDVCNLGSVSLIRFVSKVEGNEYIIDWDTLRDTVRLGVHFLDNVIDLNPYPMPQIMEFAHKIRRIGLGVMGWADMLAYLGISYASNEACDLARKIMGFINDAGHDESEQLAKIRGSFPLWDKSIYKNEAPIRNCTITTIAPTGELSILGGCSAGIEPNYGLTRIHRYENRVLYIFSPSLERFLEWARERGFYSQMLEEEVKNCGEIGNMNGIPDDVKKIFMTAHEISPEWHVKMQAAFQKHVDNGVSKTINLKNSATEEDVKSAFLLAYKSECLGVTVFRDGCKGQVFSVGIGKKPAVKTTKGFIRSRPEILGTTIKVETPDGAAFITINWDADVGPKEPFEIFITVAKAGTDAAADAEAMGRLISELLREESPLSPIGKLIRIRNHLSGIGGSRTAGYGKEKVKSIADGIGKAIDIYLKRFGFEETAKEDVGEEDPISPENGNGKEAAPIRGNYCPQCHQGTLIYEEGCTKCRECSFTLC
ncbi:MAG: adenosylcobalamin-dependent ribonucleoside-diphosphate reductase [Patescibacteria group bacterium]